MCLRVQTKRGAGKPCEFPLDPGSSLLWSLERRRLLAGDDGVSTPRYWEVRCAPRAKRKTALRQCGALEADVPVVRVHLLPGVIRVGHDAYGTRQRWLLAEGALVILVDIAHFFSPLTETVFAAFGNDHLDAGRVLVGDYGAHRHAVLPDVHQRRVGHLVARQHLHLAREEPVLERPLRFIALESDNHTHGGILA